MGPSGRLQGGTAKELEVIVGDVVVSIRAPASDVVGEDWASALMEREGTIKSSSCPFARRG